MSFLLFVMLFTLIRCGNSRTSPKVSNTGSILFPNENTGVENEDDDILSRYFSGLSFQSILPQKCGLVADERVNLRIVGGSEAARGGWPWMARLGYYDRRDVSYSCGGVLITRKHILTAAHCVYNKKNLFVVRLGSHGKNKFALQDHYIRGITIHERYVPSNQGPINDIAIITLASTVTFTADVQPICLPINRNVRNLNLPGRSLHVAGWGSTSFLGRTSNVLRQVKVPVVAPSKCVQAYKDFRRVVIDESVICAGLDSGGKDACSGDSGGPLVVNEAGRFYVMGLVSFGFGCAAPGYPGVYSRVPYHINWILSKIAY